MNYAQLARTTPFRGPRSRQRGYPLRERIGTMESLLGLPSRQRDAVVVRIGFGDPVRSAEFLPAGLLPYRRLGHSRSADLLLSSCNTLDLLQRSPAENGGLKSPLDLLEVLELVEHLVDPRLRQNE